MKRHYNTIKSIAKDIYELYKDSHPFEIALERAISQVLDPVDFSNIYHPTIIFGKKEEIHDLLLAEMQYEVNINQSVEAGDYETLTDNTGHIPWYREKLASEQVTFRFWKRYKKYLTNIKGWNEQTVNKLDEVTDDIIERIEDPTVKSRGFDRRGLVVGYVQSGKTANFTGVINKAIDCGYRIIIVLSGMHNNLRSQTQMRIDEEVIGRDTSDINIKSIGVTTLMGEGYINVDTFTTQTDRGDFNRAFAQQIGGVQPGSDRPMLFVIKKNAPVLRNLVRYFRDCISTLGRDYTIQVEERNLINNLPLLVIDDEADQASPNTNPPENEVGEEIDPKAINRSIRELLTLFNQKVYIGYTATPFANIFIHPDAEHSSYGPDLFPSSFIISLDTPSHYFGPVQVFGLNGDNGVAGYPIYKPVEDAAHRDSAFLPLAHRAAAVPDYIPESMKQALKSFIISSAIRRIRGQENKHNTMLIHCTRFNDIQNAIGRLVDEEFSRVRNGIENDDEDIVDELFQIWQSDYNRISSQMGYSTTTWDEVKANLKPAVLKMERKVHLVNGTTGDILDYKTKGNTGLSVIVIGGDKLSRGLTLEGLTVSYFIRSSTLYDTLMQMGRWFGYKNEYEDLCRIYTTPYLYDWYRHISTAFEILRKEFQEMSRQKATPMEFGLRVMSHPDLMATNAMKMRHSYTLPLTYKGKLTETAILSSDKAILINNYSASEQFILSLSSSYEIIDEQYYLWQDVPKETIISYLSEYIAYKGSPATNTKRIIEFIEAQTDNHILDLWNVGLKSLKSDKEEPPFAGLKINKISRSLKDADFSEKLFIQRLVDPKDEKIDFPEDTNFKGAELRAQTPRINRPLLMIYPMEIIKKDPEEKLGLEKSPVGFAISWPNNNNLVETTYDINIVYRELEIEHFDGII